MRVISERRHRDARVRLPLLTAAWSVRRSAGWTLTEEANGDLTAAYDGSGGLVDWTSTVQTGLILIGPELSNNMDLHHSFAFMLEHDAASANDMGVGIGYATQDADTPAVWGSRNQFRDGATTVTVRDCANVATNTRITGSLMDSFGLFWGIGSHVAHTTARYVTNKTHPVLAQVFALGVAAGGAPVGLAIRPAMFFRGAAAGGSVRIRAVSYAEAWFTFPATTA